VYLAINLQLLSYASSTREIERLFTENIFFAFICQNMLGQLRERERETHTQRGAEKERERERQQLSSSQLLLNK